MEETKPETQPKRRWKIEIEDYSVCYYCKTPGLTEEDRFCSNCGFPQRAPEMEQKKFIWAIKNKEQLVVDKKKAVKRARILLYVLSGLNLLIGLIYGLGVLESTEYFIGETISALIFFALALWSHKNPFPAILTGFLVYITFLCINAAIDPATIVQGIPLKVLIVMGFVYGYRGVKDAEKLEKELDSISKAKVITTPHDMH